MTELHRLTLAELNEGLRARRFSSVELARHFLARIERFNPALNAFITVTGEQALAAAQRADELIAAGEALPLAGLPLVHKDIFCTDGVLTTCGSRMLSNFVAPYDATVVERLSQVGVVMLGKTNMDEFAMGSSNENSWYGPVRNPWDPKKVPGGSSGGSAAAVAARLAPAATGTDTGGSIRQPAALTGLTGFKPTYGRVSRYGMIAFASSLDQAGMLTLTVRDAAMLLAHMAGFDPRDSTSVDTPVPDYVGTLEQPLAGLKIGLLKEFFDKGLEEESGKLSARRVAPVREARREARRSEPAEPAAVRADVLRRRAGGVLIESVALRRRALRSSLRESDGPDGPVQALARRRLRRRGQAPHHDRHVRAVRGLLRRLLPAGAESAAPDHGRLRARVQAGRRAHGPDVADARVRHRREGGRSGDDVSQRHLHHRREPRRPAGRVGAVRPGGRLAGRAADHRPAFRRSEAAQRRALVSARDAVAQADSEGSTND